MNLKRLVIILFCIANATLSAFVDNVANLSIEEKVGQLFFVHYIGEEANTDAKRLIEEAHIGGIIYFRWANNLSSPEKVFKLSQQLQKQALSTKAAIPLFIAIDQEGGAITRLKTGFTIFPSQSAFGQLNNAAMVEACAYAVGEELAAVGINMNFAPVADIQGDPRNPVIGIRSYSANPQKVSALCAHALRGYQRAGIIPVLKHFPGHGSVSQDSHYELPVVRKPFAAFENEDLFPFARLHEHADVMMTASIMLPELDQVHCATLSPLILRGLLRQKLGYRGLVISDSLCMGAILTQCASVADAAVEAFCAGCELLILGGIEGLGSPEQIREIHHHFVDKVREGVIDEKLVDLAVAKILSLKAKTFKAHPLRPENSEVTTFSASAEHRQLAKLAAAGTIALTCHPTFHSHQFGPLCASKVAVIAPEYLREELEMTRFSELGKATHFAYFNHHKPSLDEILHAAHLVEWADIVIVCAYNAWLNPLQMDFLQTLKGTGKPTVVMALREPYDAECLGWGDIVIKTYGPAPCSIDEALNLLKNKFLPVALNALAS